VKIISYPFSYLCVGDCFWLPPCIRSVTLVVFASVIGSKISTAVELVFALVFALVSFNICDFFKMDLWPDIKKPFCFAPGEACGCVERFGVN
jgi:hypothetical protein